MEWTDILMLALSVGAVLLLYYFLFANKDPAKRAAKSKDLSNAAAAPLAAAKRFALTQQAQVIAPAHLAKDGKFADLDFIVVGTFGLLCAKCIGRGGEIYGTAGDEKWLQVLKTTERVSFDNPLRTAEADTRVVRDTLFAAKLKGIPVETVCIFTNNDALLSLPRSTGHYTVKTFKALLGKDKYRAEKGVDIAAATAAVRAYLTEDAAK